MIVRRLNCYIFFMILHADFRLHVTPLYSDWRAGL